MNPRTPAVTARLAAMGAGVPCLLALLLMLMGGCPGCPFGHMGAQAAPCYTAFTKEDFPSCVELGPNGSYSLAWRVVDSNRTLQLALDVDNPAPQGWAGVGISEGGGMKGADMLVVRRMPRGGGLKVIDLWSVDTAAPVQDDQQDVTLLLPSTFSSASPSAPPTPFTQRPSGPDRLVAVVSRPMQTCDANGQDLAVLPGIPQPVVWAFGSDWPRYHGEGARGETVITFLNATPPAAPITLPPTNPPTTATDGSTDRGEREIELRMPNITIPTDPTSYLCTYVEVPSDTKYHVIKSLALPGGPLVHHMILFGCSVPPGKLGGLFECTSMPLACASFAIGWAPGADVGTFPPEAGYAIGSGPGVPRYFALQVHYNNPRGLSVATPDASGFRLTYTPKLRPYDVGVLTLGQTHLILPPGQPEIIAPPSVCPAECTSRLPIPVNLLGAGLHMHETGRSIITRHFRGNTELRPIGKRSSWDFGHQALAAVPFDTRILQPGDALVTQCTYDTTSREKLTRFGEATTDEMCFDFLLYYPKLDDVFTFCGTQRPAAAGQTQYAVCATPKQQAAVAANISKGSSVKKGPDEQELAGTEQALRMYIDVGAAVTATIPPPTIPPFVDPLCTAAAADAGAAGSTAAASVGSTVPERSAAAVTTTATAATNPTDSAVSVAPAPATATAAQVPAAAMSAPVPAAPAPAVQAAGGP